VKVAVVAVRVVQGAAHDEVDVVAVGNRLVDTSEGVPAGALHRRAGTGAAPAHLQPVLVGVLAVRCVEVAIVEVVGVVAVPHLAVPAPRAVLVVMASVLATGHRFPPESSRLGERASTSPAGAKMPLGGVVMSQDRYDAISALLSREDPEEIRKGIGLIREETARTGSREARPLFELVATLFYIDPLDRPDLLPVLDEAVDLVVGFGDWVIPALVEKLDAGDVKAQMAAGHALGRIGAEAIRPLIEGYAAAADESHRAFILYALGKIRSPKVVAAARLALEAAASPDLELRDTATRTLGRFAEAIPPREMSDELAREFRSRLEANLSDRNNGVRAKAIRSLGKMARQGHLRPEERRALGEACRSLIGDDGAFDWDPAFIVRREAEEALRYV
jgi:hypothetical protein